MTNTIVSLDNNVNNIQLKIEEVASKVRNVSEGDLPYRIESITMSHDNSSDDTRHTYAPVTIKIMWLKNCTVSGIVVSGSTNQPGRGLNIGSLNGYHARGSITVFSDSVDSAYGSGSCGVSFNYLNANISY